MKKTIKHFLSIAALALVGAMMTGCSSNEDLTNEPVQQPEVKDNIITQTITVGFEDDDATTRALTLDKENHKAIKTFAVGERLAICYENPQFVFGSSQPLTADDISEGGKKARFTFTMNNPDMNCEIFIVYPGSMAYKYGPSFASLSQQNGTLAWVGQNDLAYAQCKLIGYTIPEKVTLENQLAILAITLKNSDGSEDITSGITKMIVRGKSTYTINRKPAEGPIYVAIDPVKNHTIEVEATDGIKYYDKTLEGKTYEVSNGYNVCWRMNEVPQAVDPEAPDGRVAAEAIYKDVGKMIGADGKIYTDADAATAAGTTALAKICYVGIDNCEDAPYNHGLAIALSDAKGSDGYGDAWYWPNHSDKPDHAFQQTSRDFVPESGLQYINCSSDFWSFVNARNYNGGVAPAGCSPWFLGSAYQYTKMAEGVGAYVNLGLNEGNYWSASEHYYTPISHPDQKVYGAWRFNREGDWTYGDKWISYLNLNQHPKSRSIIAF